MTPERWKLVEEVFNKALDLPTEERAAYLDEACGGDGDLRRQVEHLIKCDEDAGAFIEEPAFDVRRGVATLATGLTGASPAAAERPEAMAGRRVGSYRIVREIGHGGMGTVYLAERADEAFQKRVAVKLVKRGMDTDFIVRRFHNERQILANLEHPNIARLFDGGTTDDGLPFFVMEYIEGLPVLRYCNTERLTVKERLRLFIQICNAVQYAHRNLVVHRDIKPSNILVTREGTPKLLDFGIAKILKPDLSAATHDRTMTAMRLMTPKYASPEQLRGEKVTPSTDIYSLGVLLYESLTGHHPYRLRDLPPHEVARRICEEEPERPSDAVSRTDEIDPSEETESSLGGGLSFPETVSRNRSTSPAELRRELTDGIDQLVLRAMRKDPRARYGSVEELTADIRRHLEGAPSAAPGERSDAAHLSEAGESGARRTSVAVLPFKLINYSERNDTGGDPFKVGLADALITRLSNMRGVSVRPTSSVVQFDTERADPVAAGRLLGVDYVLDGRVTITAERVRVTVQLVSTADSAPLWAAKFDESAKELLALHDSISAQVAEALAPYLSGEARALIKDDGDLTIHDSLTPRVLAKRAGATTGEEASGGRLTAPSHAGSTAEDAAQTHTTDSGLFRNLSARQRRLVALAVPLALLFALAAGAYFYLRASRASAAASIAVLPFANVKSDPDTEYLSDGLTEQLINQLSQLHPLRVMARTTAFSYKGKSVDPRQAGREMEVGAVLVGEVSKQEETLVIRVELVRVEDGSRIWGEKYSRRLSDLLLVQQDIVGEIVDQLKLKLTGAERRDFARPYTQNAQAYQLYLQGEYQRNRQTPEDLRRSIELFNAAVAADPNYALAYVGLALSYRSLPAFGEMKPQEAYPRAKEAATRALFIDPGLATAYIPLASIKFVYDWEFAEAERSYQQAIRLNPNNAEARHSYANFLTAMERFGEAAREYKIAQQLDPLSVNIGSSVAWSLYVSGRYDDALAQCRKVLERDPRHARTYLLMGEIYVQQNDPEHAIATFRKAKELVPDDALADAGLGHAYAVSGKPGEALQIVADLEARAGRGEASPFLPAVVYAGLGDKERAFAWLEKAYEERSNLMALIKTGPRLAPLRTDPRFASLLRRVGFPS